MQSGPVRFASIHPVDPTAGTWRMLATVDPQAFRAPPPPGNHTSATQAELAELRLMTQRRTAADVSQIRRWSLWERSVMAHWEALASEMARRYNLGPPSAGRIHHALTTAVYAALISAWATKYAHVRPRPSVLDPRIDTSVIPVPEHPAYPSGHSTAAGAAVTILSRFFPADAALFEAVAQDAGMSRLKAGIHYRSDHTRGLELGRQVARAVLEHMSAHDGAPTAYLPRPNAPRMTFPEAMALLDCLGAICHG
ncbi:MAG TPA: vanadium-dependent haloperoxidase [Symbiobacteriaceae bacterium]|nr:vanadium-dependent haloperoxidase [Symbiobacteriaceae bacterium]